MNEKQFKILLECVKGKETWKDRFDMIKEIIGELLGTEFHSINKKILAVITDKLRSETVLGGATTRFKDYAIVHINVSNWKKPGFDKAKLREIIRHELLHIETGLTDDDPIFKRLARSANIPLSFE
ncbi:MAG: hypothetical protein HQ555_07795 [Candidatus Aminicenantes bacterium]|nr:hypothetical protein [Candidatus Aminicenantes bacterium]